MDSFDTRVIPVIIARSRLALVLNVALNKFLKKDDILLHLGDLACGPRKNIPDLKKLMSKFDCEKHFIRGNHDFWLSDSDLLEIGFKSVRTYILLENILICHYPLDKAFRKSDYFNNDSHKHIWDLFFNEPLKSIYHGHVHNKAILRDDGITRYNCCIDRFSKGYNIIAFPSDLEPALITALQ